MRFECLDAACFGPLRDRQFELDSDIVLVYGPNEAGKSSFRAALETILFGFKPADRDAHPLAQWDPDAVEKLHLEAQLRLDTDEIQSVERVLLQTGKSRFASGRAPFSGARRGNVCVPWTSWLSRDVFASLYSLEISQLAALNPSVSADIDELLLPTPSGLPLRPLADVRAELRRDHTDLWRPDNRGKPMAKQLRKLLTDARADAGRAAEAERELRLARSEREERETELEKLRQHKKQLDREHSESPFLGALFEHRRRSRELGPMVDLTPLGDRPLLKPSELRNDIATLEQRLHAPRSRLDEFIVQLDAVDARVLDRAPEIDLFVAQQPGWEVDRERHAEHLDSAQHGRQRALDELDSVLATGADENALEAANAIPIAGLRASVASWSEQREQYATTAGANTNLARGWALALGFAGLAAVGLGTLGLVAGSDPIADGWMLELVEILAMSGPNSWLAQLADPRLAPTGALLLFASLVTALFVSPARRSEAPTAPEQLTEWLRVLDVADSLLDNPASIERLIAVLETSVRHLREAQSAQLMAEELERSIEERKLRWVELCGNLGLDRSGGGDLLLGRLRAALAAARDQQSRVAQDTAQRDEASRQCERDAPLLASKRQHAQLLERTLLGESQPDSLDGVERTPADSIELDQAFDSIIERRDEEEFLRRRAKELRAEPRFAALEHDPRIHDSPDAPWLPAIVAARDHEIAGLEEQLGREQRRLGELDELLASDAGSSLARATDRVRELESDLARLERKRDRLALLESILAHAEREFRENHQPDVLRRASLYLERITNGRYRRIDLIDDNQGRLWVTPAGRDQPVPVAEPISQGTLDQIFLCLRLGLLDHLDEDRERLPLILDDALLRMDDGRRQEVYRVLGEISPSRQVFLLTCHAAVADEIAAALKATRISL
jgi:hypothetical protein